MRIDLHAERRSIGQDEDFSFGEGSCGNVECACVRACVLEEGDNVSG